MDKNTLGQKAEELRNAANKAYEDLTAGKITQADFDQTMEHCEKDNERNSVLFKSRARANQFTAQEEAAPPQDRQQVVPDGVKEYRDQYAKALSAARSGQRGSAGFHFGFKSVADRDDIGYKTTGTAMPTGPYQGATNMVGEGTSGNTVPAALAGGTYFLAGTAGPAIEPEFIPGIVEMHFYPLVVESLFPTLPVSSPVVTYVSETSWTNNAAAVAEGATKPTSTHGFTRYTEQVGKVANLARTTDEMIQDANYVWGLVQQRLVMGVQRRTEVELLAGTGYPGVNGLFGRSASFTQSGTTLGSLSVPVPPTVSGPFGTGMGSVETVSSVTAGRTCVAAAGSSHAPVGNDIAVSILNALTDIRTQTFFEPDAIICNPQDYQTLRLSTDVNGQYYGGNFWGRNYGYPQAEPTIGGTAVDTFELWGKKLVSTPVCPAGLILVGCFADAGAVLRLGGLRVDLTNLNGNDFEMNMWTARAEARVGLLIERPYLFQLVALTTSSSWSS